MKLYLAVALLMLAFVAYTEAQEDTVEHRFTKFSEQMAEVSRGLAEKAKTTFDQIQTSEFATSTKSWFEEQFEKLKTQFQ